MFFVYIVGVMCVCGGREMCLVVWCGKPTAK